MSKLKVCLTGGIASGKTYVSDQLALMGAHVIDADVLARQVVKKGGLGLARLVDVFGSGILSVDQTLNRSKLKSIVFSDKEKLKSLNSGKDRYADFDRVLMIDVALGVQIERVKKRDGVDQQTVCSIIRSQPSRNAKLRLASDVIVNNSGFEVLDKAIEYTYDLFKKMLH